ncbi:MAG: AraC family transcriptional regulator [Firmicutes bacterium]|nr:AraC family transcriptional regulator [Bacillota bacterium]
MNILRDIRNNKMLKFWIGSYLAIVLVSIGVNMIGHTAIIQITNAEMQRSTSNLTSQMSVVYDSYFRQIEASAYNLLESYAVRSLINMPKETENKSDWIKTAIRDIALQESSVPIAENIVLIFNHENICIVSNAMYTKEIAYSLLFEPYYSTKEAWLSDAFSVLHKEYKSIVTSKGEQKTFFVYAYSILNQEPPLLLMIELNESVLHEALSQVGLAGSNRMMIVDESGYEMFRGNSTPALLHTLEGDSGFVHIEYNGEKYSASYVASKVLPCKYVYMVKTADYTKQMNTIGLLFQISYILCLLIGVALSLWFVKRNYRPIHTLAGKLKNNVRSTGKGAFETIEHAVENLLKDKKQRDRLTAIQQNTAKEVFLSRLAGGRFLDDKEVIFESFGKHKIAIDAVSMCIVLFSIQEFGVFTQKEDASEEDEKLVQIAISNVFLELMSDAFQLNFFRIDDYYACLVLALSELHNTSYIKKQLNTLLSFLLSNFDLLFTAALSQTADDPRMIPKLYSQALEAMSYRLLLDEDSLLDYDQLMSHTQAYSYRTQDNNKLINLLSCGSAEETIVFVKDIIDRNRREKNINIHMMRMLLLELANTLLKVTIDIDKEHLLDSAAFSEKLMQWMDFSKLEDILEHMYDYIRQLSAIIKKNQLQTEVVRCNNIKRYVEKHSTNPGLTVGMISAEFGLSLSYLSSNFKEQTGEGIAEYIAKCRIEHSKQMLEQTNLSIGDIGDKVGFFSTAVFIRAFKKFEFTTPGQYRKIHQNQKSRNKDE